jgi:hypothetical protein
MSKTAELNLKNLTGVQQEFAYEFLRILREKGAFIDPVRRVAIASAALERSLSNSTREAKLAQALARGISVRERMAAEEGGSMSAEEAARYLGLTKQSVLNLYHGGKLLGWRSEKQAAVRLPVWQFANGQRLPGLANVLAVLSEPGTLDDWGKIGFFLQTHAVLGNKRPLDLLRDNRVEPVLKAAAEYVE